MFFRFSGPGSRGNHCKTSNGSFSDPLDLWGMDSSLFYEGFSFFSCFLNRFLNLEALKLISLAFLWLQDHVHEKERTISDRMVPRIPSGMIWSPSYDRFCVFIYFSPNFPFIFPSFRCYFELQWLWDYVHEKERKISFRMVLRIPSGMVWSPSYDQFYVSLCASLLSTLFRPFWDPPWSILNHQGKFWAHTPLVVSPAGSSSLPNSFHPYNFWA